jgi:hypothetical protein
MKHIKKILLGALIVAGLQFGIGCVADVGGPGPWYHDGPWMDGPRWGGGVYVHPAGWRR